MTQKYAAFDQRLFAWLAENREDVTTSQVSQDLEINDGTVQRHISRRFTQLEDRGIIECRLEGTTRVCSVKKDLPTTFAKKRWRPGPGKNPAPPLKHTSIVAADSNAFEAAGGKIEKLPTQWDHKPSCNAIGLVSIDHILAALD